MWRACSTQRHWRGVPRHSGRSTPPPMPSRWGPLPAGATSLPATAAPHTAVLQPPGSIYSHQLQLRTIDDTRGIDLAPSSLQEPACVPAQALPDVMPRVSSTTLLCSSPTVHYAMHLAPLAMNSRRTALPSSATPTHLSCTQLTLVLPLHLYYPQTAVLSPCVYPHTHTPVTHSTCCSFPVSPFHTHALRS
jgi:hypothetical protein